jgi:Zn-dependent protease
VGSNWLATKTVALALTLVPMILSLSVHECAHAFSAYLLGDKTARDAGRLTLNPAVHIDPLGTLFFPTLNVLLSGVGFLGWARPTPFRPDQMRRGVNRRLGGALVSAAGPLSNLLLAVLSLALIVTLGRVFHVSMQRTEEFTGPESYSPVGMLLLQMFRINVGLFVFNLLPFPPLDGHYLLPPLFDPIIVPLQRYGFAILFLIFLIPGAGALLFGPINWISIHLLDLFGL